MLLLTQIQKDKALFDKAVRQVTPEILGSVIDHTMLKPDARGEDIRRLCDEADTIGSSICVNGSRIVTAQTIMAVKGLGNIRGIAAVIDFPFGAGTSDEKAGAAKELLVTDDAGEIDMVLNIGMLLDSQFGPVKADIRSVAFAVRHVGATTGIPRVLKVIQENCYLNNEQIRIAAGITASIAEETNVHMFAKTSTGFGVPKDESTPTGATLKDIHLMCRVIAPYQARGVKIGIKAAGGIGDAEMAVKMMLAAGCFDEDLVLRDNLSDIFRIGASAGPTIVNDFKEKFCQ